ncbi:hypothetical protein HBO38_30420 [Pseudomonas veronii]|uniref:Uncharacterized protein n=1 Tax=Pseudomonas veronii TaxID=76761 RepID=A0A7Y1ABH4_PSEVE|nr:hypothetical protein [Pseudomonas veronii]
MIRVLVLIAMLPDFVMAYESKRAANNLAHEYAECAAFYTVSSTLFESQDPKLAERMNQSAINAMNYSQILTSEKLTDARIEMAVKSIIRDLDNDIANVSIILNKYSDRCVEAMTDPEARMDYWLKKQD